jgi:hypothetical protein
MRRTVVILCSSKRAQCFRGTYHLHLQSLRKAIELHLNMFDSFTSCLLIHSYLTNNLIHRHVSDLTCFEHNPTDAALQRYICVAVNKGACVQTVKMKYGEPTIYKNATLLV